MAKTYPRLNIWQKSEGGGGGGVERRGRPIWPKPILVLTIWQKSGGGRNDFDLHLEVNEEDVGCMEKVRFVVLYDGEWSKSGGKFKYQSGKSKVNLVSGETSYESLHDIVSRLVNVNSNESSIKMKFMFNSPEVLAPFEVVNDDDVQIFLCENSVVNTRNCTKKASSQSQKGADGSDPKLIINKQSKFIDACWNFMRPYSLYGNVAVSVSLVTRSWIIENPDLITWSLLLKACSGLLALIFLNGYISGINQIYDIDIDKINKPYLPIVAGELSVESAWLLVIFYAVTGLFTVGLNGGLFLTCLYSLALFLGTAYSVPPFRLKRFAFGAMFTIVSARSPSYHHIILAFIIKFLHGFVVSKRKELYITCCSLGVFFFIMVSLTQQELPLDSHFNGLHLWFSSQSKPQCLCWSCRL
ncbi:hypothetical protein Dsin_022695 [Dipteronia sinensis]|uniref:Uncharacterized protein n=1 Tax=Dipteronia sinensis TaxID=43782 RepID=A0AAE0A2F4_9ROSI|nr:hypothetical protein Dsin_022695 [Dipteronia sinensis]